MKKNNLFFDAGFNKTEQIPRKFTVRFDPVKVGTKDKIRVTIDGNQLGDVIDDNSKENDGYRFHDVFHYTFAAMLGWSPCMRAMMKLKRKSNPTIDETEDGARATITEESISLMVFNKAKLKNFFKEETQVSPSLLTLIKEMTSSFEVAVRSKKEWEAAILKSYSLFRALLNNNGGKIHFDMINRSAVYEN